MFGGLAEYIAEVTRNLFESYGYWVVFLGTLAENTLFLGLLVPGVLVIFLAGLEAEEGVLNLPLVLGLGIAGTVLGDTISYTVGRLFWRRLLRNEQAARWAERLREPIYRWRVLFVLLYHFAGYSRLLGPAAAGVLRIPLRQWAPLDYAGAALWVSVFALAGFFGGTLGLTLDPEKGNFRIFEWALLAAFVIWILILARTAQRRWARAHQKASEEGQPPAPMAPVGRHGLAAAPEEDPPS